MLSDAVKQLCNKVADYYESVHGDKYEQELKRVQFRKIDIVDGVAHFHVVHPGVFIGRKGENWEKLSVYLGMEMKLFEVADDIYSYLISTKDFDIDYEYDYDVTAFDFLEDDSWSGQS